MSESRLWRDVDADLFRFATTDRRELYLALMTTFDRSATLDAAMNLDRVREALRLIGWDLPTDDDTLQLALGQLTDWHLLEATQDHAAQYVTPEDFERKNLQWSLTRRGEAAIGGVLSAINALRHAVGLQPAVLDAIGDTLSELLELLSGPRVPANDARIHVLVAQAEGHLAALITSVRQFNGHLQRLLRDDAVDDQVFADVKRRTVAYLEEYVTGVEQPQRRLRTLLPQVAEHGVETVFDRALSGANLAPVPGTDPGPSWIAERRRHWESLRAWFAPTDATPARIDGLLDTARMAIVELLRVLERRWDQRRRSASVARDFRALADWFAAAPGEAEAHRLFAAAFGLWPARHAHELPVDGEATRPAASWLTTPPVEVAPALRSTGTLTQRGRSHPIGDPARTRAARQREQAAALAAHRELQAALSTPGRVRLSAFGELDSDGFAELLTLLGAALAAPQGSDGIRRTLSADGRVEISLSPPTDGRVATLPSPEGVLRGPDLWVSITLTDAASSPLAEEVSSA